MPAAVSQSVQRGSGFDNTAANPGVLCIIRIMYLLCIYFVFIIGHRKVRSTGRGTGTRYRFDAKCAQRTHPTCQLTLTVRRSGYSGMLSDAVGCAWLGLGHDGSLWDHRSCLRCAKLQCYNTSVRSCVLYERPILRIMYNTYQYLLCNHYVFCIVEP